MLHEKKEDILENIEDAIEDAGLEKATTWVASHLKATATGILALVLVLAAVFLFLSHNRQSVLQQQIAQQTVQIERLNQIIDALRKQLAIDPDKPIPVITTETLKSQINTLQQLVTQEYIYTNADQRTDYAKWFFDWKRPFSDTSLLVTYDGSIKAGIDLKEVQVAVNEEIREITITLPQAKITDNNIPQGSIKVLEAKNGLFNEITLDDYNTFISEQQIIMENKAIERGLLEKADEEAKKAIETFLAPLPGMSGEDAYTLKFN